MIGILDLQGGIVEHLEHLERLGLAARRVKVAPDLAGLTGLILPGGESTCVGRLLRITGLDTAIRAAAADGLRLWGTCAGAILLARELRGETPHLGLIDITVERNAYGSQLDSFTGRAVVPAVAPDPLPLVFIRAPAITRVGPDVRVLLKLDGRIVAAESPAVLVTTFHPELSACVAFHAYFARRCGLRPAATAGAGPAPLAKDWSLTSWTRFLPPPGPALKR